MTGHKKYFKLVYMNREAALYSALKDEELMERYIQGEEAAFSELYQRYAPRVYGFVKKRLQNPGLIEDVFQNTFLKLHRSKEQFDSNQAFAPWLFTICNSVVIDLFKSSEFQKGQLTDVREDVSDLAGAVEDQEVSSENEMSEKIKNLSSDDQNILQWRFFDEQSFAEIAKKLESNEASIRKRVSRAVNRLKDLMISQGGQK